jgi:hypothetical protein
LSESFNIKLGQRAPRVTLKLNPEKYRVLTSEPYATSIDARDRTHSEDIGRPKERGKAILKEMAVRLIERRSAEEAIKDYDSQIANYQQRSVNLLFFVSDN